MFLPQEVPDTWPTPASRTSCHLQEIEDVGPQKGHQEAGQQVERGVCLTSELQGEDQPSRGRSAIMRRRLLS